MASKGVNKVILIGHLGRDPEVRYTQDGKAVVSLALATSESWKGQSGQVQEKTEWHRVSIFGKLAEIAGEYLRKGSHVYIEGKLQTKKWQNKQGQDQYTTEIALDPFNGVMQMLSSKSDSGAQRPANQQTEQYGGGQQAKGYGQQSNGYQSQSQPARQPPRQNQPAQQNQNQRPPMSEPDFDFDGDIPFAPIGLQFPKLLSCI